MNKFFRLMRFIGLAGIFALAVFQIDIRPLGPLCRVSDGPDLYAARYALHVNFQKYFYPEHWVEFPTGKQAAIFRRYESPGLKERLWASEEAIHNRLWEIIKIPEEHPARARHNVLYLVTYESNNYCRLLHAVAAKGGLYERGLPQDSIARLDAAGNILAQNERRPALEGPADAGDIVRADLTFYDWIYVLWR